MGIRNIRRAMMKKNMTTIEKKFIAVWLMHFGHADLYPGEEVSCEECMEYIVGLCCGAHVPEECMIEQAKTLEVRVIVKFA